MTFKDWVVETNERTRNNGVAGLQESAYEFYVGIWRNLGRRLNFGRSVFEESWDVLVVLDACRWDLMQAVQPDYDFVDSTASYSNASSSEEWMRKTFTGVDTSNVALVTANPFSKDELDMNDFLVMDEVWGYAVDDEIHTIPAEAVTDRAIQTFRDYTPNKLIVHYMQPHFPFVPNPMTQTASIEKFGMDSVDDIWDKLRRGELERENVWKNYRANLRYVLDNVAVLLNNVNGEVLITADHGNLLGEFGLYGHPDYVSIPALKRVPWCKTTAEDIRSHEPTNWGKDHETANRDELLRDLGYR